MDPTTRTDIPSENTSFYSRTLLEAAVPQVVHMNWAEIVDIPGGMGTDTVKFRKYAALAAQTTPLVEGVTPAGKKLSVTDITAQVQYYGDYVTLTDKVNIESLDPVLTVAADKLGEQVGQSLDLLMRDVMAAGTTKQYASSAVSRVTVAAGMYFNAAESSEAVLTLKLNYAKPVMNRVDPSTGYNTIPLKPAFIGIIHPRTTSYLENNESKWTPVEKYSNKSDVMPYEVGSLPYVRFVESANAAVFTGEGAGGIDVYGTLIFGQRAYTATRISTLTLQNIVKPLGSAGSADPLNQRATSGWKLSFVGKITQQGWIIRVEHAN